MAEGIEGLLGRLFPGNDPAALYGGALTDPATQAQMGQRGLLAMAGSFADSAMPTRMPTPLGAVLGHAAAALGTSQDAVMGARLQAAQAQQAIATGSLAQGRADIIKGLPADMAGYYGMESEGGGAIPSTPAPGAPIPGAIGTGPAPTGPINPELVTWEAKNQGINPLVAHTTADIESSYGTNTGNKVSPSNTGVFQRAKADEPGGQNDTFDNQIKLGVSDLVTARAGLRASLGREPTNAEVYLAHQQGVSGATKLITNPNTPAGQLVRPVNISNNAGNPNAPASAFVQHWEQAYNKREAKFAPLAASLSPMAQANTVPAGRVAPPGLLGPSGQTIDQLANQAMADRPPPAPAGLLAGPPPGAGPAISPETIATLKSGGMTDEQIARITGAQSVAAVPPGAAPPGPPGPVPVPPPGAGAPPPPQAPPVPPIAQPQVAAAPGAIPGAPSVAKQQAASRLMLKFALAGIPLPPDVEATAKFGLTVAQAAAVAAATSPIEVAKAVAIANGTLPAEIAKARAGPAESGAQARLTAAEAYGNEIVLVPGMGYMQRRNIPGYVAPGGAAAGSTAPAPRAPGTAAAPGAAAPASGILYPERTPEQEMLQKGLGEVQRDEYKSVVTEAASAEGAKPFLLAIQQALQTFNNPGAGAQTKLDMAKMLQQTLLSAHVPVPETLNDWIAAGEVTAKAGTKLGFELSRTLGAHEAEGIVNQAVRNNPGLATSLEGNRQLVGLMSAIIDRTGAKRQFYDDWLDPKKGAHSSLAGAATEFNRQNPQEVMVSQFAPYLADQLGHDDASAKAAYDKLPPGVKMKDPKTGREWIKPASGGQ